MRMSDSSASYPIIALFQKVADIAQALPPRGESGNQNCCEGMLLFCDKFSSTAKKFSAR